MDPDGRMIPVVEGDQGEGFKDLIDEYSEVKEHLENKSELRFWREQERLRSRKRI